MDVKPVDKKAERKAKRLAKKAEKEAADLSKKAPTDQPKVAGGGSVKTSLASATSGNAHEGDGSRTATGLLACEKRSRDIKIGSFSLSFHSKILVEDSEIEFNHGNRYGLIGMNGCGKSTLLQCLAAREVPIPDHIDIYLLTHEAPPTARSALEWVVDSAKAEVARLEALSEEIITTEGPESEVLMDIYDSLDGLDPATFESRASKILIGLGFNRNTLHKKTEDMSGGWRMRVALARALFIKPSLLLLDEPTNHLDLEACVWLESYLATYDKILVVVSHSQDFLNGVCTNTMVMQQKKLKYWGGNYDTYCKTRIEQDTNQLKMYKKQQEEIKHTKQFIASCGTFSNLVRQAKSRQKQLDKMVEAGLIECPYEEPRFRFQFPQVGQLQPPVISFTEVAFSYSGKKEDYLYSDLNFGMDSDSRIALVGPNGAGKSTLLKLITGDICPCEGRVSLRAGLSLGRYHQHSADQLDMDLSPVAYMEKKFKHKHPTWGLEEWRGRVGRFGINGDQQLNPISQLSDGLKTRLVFADIAMHNPHILLLDEPTNHCDMEMIDSMAEAIDAYEGGLILVSHDFRLLGRVAKEIWVVDRGVVPWKGDILSYKKSLIDKSGAL